MGIDVLNETKEARKKTPRRVFLWPESFSLLLAAAAAPLHVSSKKSSISIQSWLHNPETKNGRGGEVNQWGEKKPRQKIGIQVPRQSHCSSFARDTSARQPKKAKAQREEEKRRAKKPPLSLSLNDR
jgi:hypothetical protein